MIKTKITEWDRVYETEDSFGEYQTYKKKTWYLFGIPVWFKKYDFEDHGIMEFFKRRGL